MGMPLVLPCLIYAQPGASWTLLITFRCHWQLQIERVTWECGVTIV
jgi:hypothetical protein